MTSTFAHRAAIAPWLNDVRNLGMPGEAWPHLEFDDQTFEDLSSCIRLQAESGYNEFVVAGMLVGRAWPRNLAGAVVPERRRRVRGIVETARRHGVRFLLLLGVYSWGFDEIIEADSAVRGTNPHHMCGSKEESWLWMKRVLDFVLSEFDVDGFHLESGDQGRCSCAACIERGDIEYHCELNERVARYVRDEMPSATLIVNMCGQLPWGSAASAEDLRHLSRLGETIDCLIDPGHAGSFIRLRDRPRLVRGLSCSFGTCGGLWVYPPQYWDRLRWFLPHPRRTGRHLGRLHADGGRAAELYMGPTLNPGVELNIACGGRLLQDVQRPIEEVVSEVVDLLYQPRTGKARETLARLFLRAEEAYFGRWSARRITGRAVAGPAPAGTRWQGNHGPVPGEIHLTFLDGAAPEVASYLGPPFLDEADLADYRRELLSMLDQVAAVESETRDRARTERLKTCLRATVGDVDSMQKMRRDGLLL